jgi:hypothetical protein
MKPFAMGASLHAGSSRAPSTVMSPVARNADSRFSSWIVS